MYLVSTLLKSKYVQYELIARMNEEYLVSAGVDKVLIIWDHDSGEKVARFGQQPNISAGIHLAHDMVIAMTIDGVVRAFAIREKEMVKQFRVADLSKQDGLSLSDRKALQEMGSGAGGSCAIQWATGDGPIVTVSYQAK
jgi:pyrimidine and pyridine-specific 5'-nucleotidase